MSRKRHLPPSPLAPRRWHRIEVTTPQGVVALRDRLRRLAREQRERPNEFDRLIAAAETWSRTACDEAGLKPNESLPEDRYPAQIWYASQVRSRIAEIRGLRDEKPDLALGLALVLGELIGEARAHLSHGEDAARGLKGVLSARTGHEHVHGTDEAKKSRWRAQRSAFERHRAKGHSITAAESLAAEECGVSTRTIHAARKRTCLE